MTFPGPLDRWYDYPPDEVNNKRKTAEKLIKSGLKQFQYCRCGKEGLAHNIRISNVDGTKPHCRRVFSCNYSCGNELTVDDVLSMAKTDTIKNATENTASPAIATDSTINSAAQNTSTPNSDSASSSPTDASSIESRDDKNNSESLFDKLSGVSDILKTSLEQAHQQQALIEDLKVKVEALEAEIMRLKELEVENARLKGLEEENVGLKSQNDGLVKQNDGFMEERAKLWEVFRQIDKIRYPNRP